MREALLSENLQRVGFLSYVPELLRRFGVDPLEVLAAAGLNANALNDPEGTIPYRAMGLLAQVACEKTHCPHFGLEIGRQIRIETLGLLGELMRHSPTLRVALQNFALNQHRNAHGGVAYLMEDDRQAFFGYAVYQPGVPGKTLICDGAAMGVFTVFCELVGKDNVSALEVLLSRSEPQNVAHYRQSFGVKLSFNADQTAVAFPRRMLDKPIAGADARRRLVVEKQVRALWYSGDMDLATQLRRELRVGLMRGHVSAVAIAARLGMSRRTLHRRLEASGLQFQEALDETRCEYAQQLLAYTRLEIAHITTIVGYTDPSVLTRGFVRWTGMTPSQWRADLAAKADACAGFAFSKQ
jgi:AraC-like DNA-binding protein